MPIIVCLFMNFLVIASSFLITYRVFQISNFVDSLICWFLIYLSQIILTELCLGVLGVLYLNNVIMLNLSIFLFVWLVSKNRSSNFNFRGILPTTTGSLENKIILLGCSVLLGFALVKIFINLINPPFGWDNLNYHFTFPVEWLKRGDLNNPIIISDDPSPSYYPINGSLFYLWFMLPLRNVFLADLGQFPFFILAFLCLYNIAIKIGIEKKMSLYGSVLFCLIPNVFKQLEIAYVDIMVVALFLAGLNYLLLLNKKFCSKYVLIFSISTGLLIGTKTVALPYSILFIVPLVYILVRNINKSYLCLVSVLTILILGGFSYLRNLLHTGNPIYPLSLNLFGMDLLKGVMSLETYRTHFKISDYSLTKLLFHEGLGIQTLIFVLPSCILALPITLIKKREIPDFKLTYFLLLPLMIYLIYRYLIPLANARYLYPVLATGIIVGFYSASILNIPKKIIDVLVVISILSSIIEIAKYRELLASLILTTIIFVSLTLLVRNFKYRELKLNFLAISLLIALTILVFNLLKIHYEKNEFARYTKMIKYSGFWPDATNAWEWLNSNTNGNNIAYIGRPVPFPLYGSNFKNNVYYVSVNEIEPAMLHRFQNSRYLWGSDFLSLHKNLESEGNYRSSADYPIWLNNLLIKNTDYLFIYSLHQTQKIEFPLEDSWARQNSSRFEPVFINESIHIYKIKKHN